MWPLEEQLPALLLRQPSGLGRRGAAGRRVDRRPQLRRRLGPTHWRCPPRARDQWRRRRLVQRPRPPQLHQRRIAVPAVPGHPRRVRRGRRRRGRLDHRSRAQRHQGTTLQGNPVPQPLQDIVKAGGVEAVLRSEGYLAAAVSLTREDPMAAQRIGDRTARRVDRGGGLRGRPAGRRRARARPRARFPGRDVRRHVRLDGPDPRRLDQAQGGTPRAPSSASGFKTTASFATLANGAASHALEFDDIATFGGHSQHPLTAAALALGEKLGASGRDAVLAWLVGWDVIAQTSKLCLGPAGNSC